MPPRAFLAGDPPLVGKCCRLWRMPPCAFGPERRPVAPAIVSRHPGRMERGVALYWDFENIHLSVLHLSVTALVDGKTNRKRRSSCRDRAVNVNAIMAHVQALGRVDINRAYGNFCAVGASYASALNEHAVDLVQLFPRVGTKNGADIRLALDVVEDLERFPHIGTVVLVAGDSDFIAVSQKVRQRGKTIIGIGTRAATSRYLAAACHSFVFYEELLQPKPAVVAAAKPLSPKDNDSMEELRHADVPQTVAGVDKVAPAAGEVVEASARAGVATPATTAHGARDASERVRALLCRAVLAEMEQSKLPYARKAAIMPRMSQLDDADAPVFGRSSYFYTHFSTWLAEACSDILLVSKGANGLPEVQLARGAAEVVGVVSTAGAPDAGAPDADVDSGAVDAGLSDAGTPVNDEECSFIGAIELVEPVASPVLSAHKDAADSTGLPLLLASVDDDASDGSDMCATFAAAESGSLAVVGVSACEGERVADPAGAPGARGAPPSAPSCAAGSRVAALVPMGIDPGWLNFRP